MIDGFKRDDGADVDMTSFHDVTVDAEFDALVGLFGPPGPGDGGYKVRHEWTFSRDPASAGSKGVTLYDWKDDGRRSGHWHVGGERRIDCLAFKRWLQARMATCGEGI